MPGNGRVQLTGKLGDVLKESVEVALTWVKAHAYELSLTSDPHVDIMKDRSIHVHCPSGAIPKDGPSSGIGQAIALISLFSGKPVPPTMAMTVRFSPLNLNTIQLQSLFNSRQIQYPSSFPPISLNTSTLMDMTNVTCNTGRDIPPRPSHRCRRYQGKTHRCPPSRG